MSWTLLLLFLFVSFFNNHFFKNQKTQAATAPTSTTPKLESAVKKTTKWDLFWFLFQSWYSFSKPPKLAYAERVESRPREWQWRRSPWGELLLQPPLCNFCGARHWHWEGRAMGSRGEGVCPAHLHPSFVEHHGGRNVMLLLVSLSWNFQIAS